MQAGIQSSYEKVVGKQSAIRRLLIGAPLHSDVAGEHRLSKLVALPVFSSDALSSVAYATQESMIALSVAGTALYGFTFGIGIVIALLLTILTISYTQTIHAYPGGGGAYVVARENLGKMASQVAAVAVLTDYVLTVAVSVSSGIDAVLSAYHGLNHLEIRLGLNIICTLFIMFMNLRGVKESGSAFAVPTYVFVFSIITMIGTGLFQWFTRHTVAHVDLLSSTHTVSVTPIAVASGAMLIWIVLHGFASGCTALTGVEAISNGIPAFRPPESKNAASTMQWMAIILCTMFLGISFLAQHLALLPGHHLVASPGGETVLSQITHGVFGDSWFYYVVQWATFAVLILAANTSFAGFPRLSAIAAQDRCLPRWFNAVGDRLVYQNGIIVLAFLALVLQLLFRGSTTALIPLYAIGVFLGFTLSQAGMVVRWHRMKNSGWRLRSFINGLGSVTTAIVTIVFAVVKFAAGAWVVLVLIPLLVTMLTGIDHHYEFVRRRLRLSSYRSPRHPRPNAALVLVPDLDDSTLIAVEYARLISRDVGALHLRQDPAKSSALMDQWRRYAPDIPLQIADDRAGGWNAAVMDELYYRRSEDRMQISTVVLPRRLQLQRRYIVSFSLSGHIKRMLVNEPSVVVADTSSLCGVHEWAGKGIAFSCSLLVAAGGPSGTSQTGIRSVFRSDRHIVLLLVAGLHRGIVEAINYSRQLGRDVRALHIELEPSRTEELREGWDRWAGDIPLLIFESPYRQLREPLMALVEAARKQRTADIITVVIPEFVPAHARDRYLHNQSGLLLKLALEREPDVVVINLRYFLDR